MRVLAVVAALGCLAACTSGPSGPAAPNPVTSAPPPSPAEGPLSGRWIGLTSEGMGLIETDTTGDDYCINRYDWEGTLSHQGTRLTGPMTVAFVGADCRSGRRGYHISPADMGNPPPVPTVLGLTVHPSGGVSVTWDEWVRTIGGIAGELNTDIGGTYTTNTITMGSTRSDRRSTWSLTFGLRRR